MPEIVQDLEQWVIGVPLELSSKLSGSVTVNASETKMLSVCPKENTEQSGGSTPDVSLPKASLNELPGDGVATISKKGKEKQQSIAGKGKSTSNKNKAVQSVVPGERERNATAPGAGQENNKI